MLKIVHYLQEVISTYDKKDSTSIDFKRNDYSKELTKNIKGKKIGIPKEYRVEGMPKEIEDLWQKGIDSTQKNVVLK